MKRIHHPVLAVLLSMLTAAFVLPALPAQAAVTFVSTLAGPSVAAMYDSGLEFDDANNRIVVADTGRDRIDFYDESGNIVAPPFGTHGTANGQFDSPRDAAIGPGSRIFVADAGNNRVQAFSSTGQWLWTVGGTGTCNTCLNTPIGVTWDAANAQLLVASTGQDRIKAFDQNGLWLWSSPLAGTGPAQINIDAPRDAGRGPDGRLWVADYDHHQVKAFDVSSTGVFASTSPAITLGDGVAQGHGDGQVNFPYNMDFSLDGHTVYVSDTGNNRVAMWDLQTSPPTWIGAFGGNCPETPDTCADPPADFGFIDTLRRVVIDSVGNAITADFWGNGMQTWTAAGVPINEIELVTPPAPGVAQSFGIAVGPEGSVYVVDRLNQRLERFNASGVFQNSAGNRGTTPGRFSWPEAIAVAPDGSVWVGDTRNDRIQKFPASLSPLPTAANVFGGGGTAVGKFNYIEDLDVGPNGLVYVADTRNNRIQVFTPGPNTFTAIGTLGSGNGQFNQPQGVAVSSTNIYVADTGNNRIQMLDLSGNYVAQYSTGLSGPQGVALAPDGTIWLTDTNNNRLVHLSGNLQANMGDGFGGAGTGNMQFNLPHTLAVFGSKLYVADTFNDRVQVFDTGVIVPDTTRPTVTISSPNAGQSFPQGTVQFNGTASDNVGVAAVRVGIQNTTSGQWLQSNGTWAAGQQLLTTTLSAPGANTTGWSFAWTFPAGAGSYSLIAESADAAGNLANPKPTRAFTVTSGLDTTVPAVTVTVPASNQSFPNGPITFSGTATDNLGVTRVDVDIKDRTSGLWWRSNGTWGAFQLQPAVTGTPGATSTSWNFTWTPPAGDGAYSVFAQPQDARGNKVNKTVQFNVSAGGGGDATAPAVTVTVPAANQSFPGGAIVFSGNATDNVGVTRVEVDVKDLNTNLWWRSDGTWGAYQAQTASIGTPGGTSTTWSYNWTPPSGSGLFSVFAQAQDAAANKGSKTVQFSVTSGGGGGGLNATYNRQVSNAGAIAPLYPAGGATAANGDRYIADSGGSRIVKITSAGVQTTLSDVTAGWNDPRDIDIDVSDPSSLWVMDTSDSQIVKMSAAGAILSTFGGSTVFKTPYGLANDASGVYVADTYNQRVSKINKTTGANIWTQTTCSGTAFLRPRDVAIGSDGIVYVADTDNNRIVKLNATTGACISAFGTTGTGNANFKAPRSLTSDGAGGLWVADAGNNRLKHVSNTGTFIGTVGTAGTGNGQFRSAHCVFRDGAFIDVCDTFNFRIQRFSVNGSGVPAFSDIVGGTQPANGGFNGAFDLAYAADGSMFAVDWFNHRIEKFDAAGNFLFAFGGYGSLDGSFIFPRGVTVAPNGEVVVMDSENNRIDVFTSSGTFLRKIKPATGQTQFSRPYQVAVGPDGSYWVADNLNNRIVNINSTTGAVITSWNGGGVVSGPRGIAVDANGNVYVSNTNNRVDKYTSAGALLQQLATNGAGPTQVKGSYGLRIVGTGANAMLLIADAGNNRVVAMTLAGVAIATFGSTGSGNGQFSSPRGVDRNPLTGEIAVADFLNNRLSIWTTS